MLLEGIEKLINEHGSSTILKERIALANDKHSLLEDKIKNLESENQALKLNLEQAEQQISVYKAQLNNIQNTNPDGYVCDNCGGNSLNRIGSRPDPTFGTLGVKQKIFMCNSCGQKSAFTPDN